MLPLPHNAGGDASQDSGILERGLYSLVKSCEPRLRGELACLGAGTGGRAPHHDGTAGAVHTCRLRTAVRDAVSIGGKNETLPGTQCAAARPITSRGAADVWQPHADGADHADRPGPQVASCCPTWHVPAALLASPESARTTIPWPNPRLASPRSTPRRDGEPCSLSNGGRHFSYDRPLLRVARLQDGDGDARGRHFQALPLKETVEQFLGSRDQVV